MTLYLYIYMAEKTGLFNSAPLNCDLYFKSGQTDKHIMTNQAAWIKQKHAQIEVDAASDYEPGTGELLVKVEVIAFSPIDSKTQK